MVDNSHGSFHFPGWEHVEQAYGTPGMVNGAAQHYQWSASPAPTAYDYVATAALPPVFCTEAELTLASSPSKSTGNRRSHDAAPGSSSGSDAVYSSRPSQPQHRTHDQHPSQPAADAAYAQQLEQRNAELLRQCQQMQEQLDASSATAASSPQRLPPPGGDLEAERLLTRRLAAKQREADSAASALSAAQQQLQAREAELEAERERVAALADALADCKDSVLQREKEVKALAHKLEAASSHIGLLENTVTALKKQGSEQGKVLAQRDVAVRGLEDRLRALQGSDGSKDRQLEALHSERQALQQDNSALHRQAQGLQAEVHRLEAALGEALGQVAMLRGRSKELEARADSAAAAAAAAQLSSIAATPPAGGSASRGGRLEHELSELDGWQRYDPQQQQYGLQQLQPGWGGSGSSELCASPRSTTSHHLHGGRYGFGSALPPFADAPGYRDSSLVQQRCHDGPSSRSRQQQQQPPHYDLQQQHESQQQGHSSQRAGLQHHPATDSLSADGTPLRGVLQQHNQPVAPTGPGGRYEAAADEACRGPASQLAGPRWQQLERPHTAAAGVPPQAGQRSSVGGSPCGSTQLWRGGSSRDGGEDDEALSVRLRSAGLATPSSASPFGTDDTLQDMLERTAEMEARLLALNAEKNELEAESARMPAHTAGRTMVERRRRTAVEGRLEEIGREVSGVRLQLRRLGVR
ncbi:hypothetical protein D9Q98_002912 [Chlorella vulgaris]|uniref:Uncharacterized protein n=1 Tax=Chlorella vulgaris TaxID=3077 RepID=A0A9D4YZK5_CHLVU|nr:hypothetical protein D9Q98_002912 [Chlorella vulgaris]